MRHNKIKTVVFWCREDVELNVRRDSHGLGLELSSDGLWLTIDEHSLIFVETRIGDSGGDISRCAVIGRLERVGLADIASEHDMVSVAFDLFVGNAFEFRLRDCDLI